MEVSVRKKTPQFWKKSKFGAFTNFWGLPTPNIWYPFYSGGVCQTKFIAKDWQSPLRCALVALFLALKSRSKSYE